MDEKERRDATEVDALFEIHNVLIDLREVLKALVTAIDGHTGVRETLRQIESNTR